MFVSSNNKIFKNLKNNNLQMYLVTDAVITQTCSCIVSHFRRKIPPPHALERTCAHTDEGKNKNKEQNQRQVLPRLRISCLHKKVHHTNCASMVDIPANSLF